MEVDGGDREALVEGVTGEQACPGLRSVQRAGAFPHGLEGGHPEWLTIFYASFGPIPLISPEPRWRRTPCPVAGSTVVSSSTWNCRPSYGWTPHRPRSRSASPGWAPRPKIDTRDPSTNRRS